MMFKDFINIDAFQYRDMRAWCREQFGTGGYDIVDGEHKLNRWDSWSYCDDLSPGQMMKWRGEAFFRFAEEKDYTWFVLRWGA
jgi:hypothetical protein